MKCSYESYEWLKNQRLTFYVQRLRAFSRPMTRKNNIFFEFLLLFFSLNVFKCKTLEIRDSDSRRRNGKQKMKKKTRKKKKKETFSYTIMIYKCRYSYTFRILSNAIFEISELFFHTKKNETLIRVQRMYLCKRWILFFYSVKLFTPQFYVNHILKSA